MGPLHMTINIRPIDREHKKQIVAITSALENNLFNPNPPSSNESADVVEEWILNSKRKPMYRAALMDNLVVGIGGAVEKNLDGYGPFANIYFRVCHNHTGQGIGKALAIRGIEEAMALRLTCLAITRANNIPAIKLLESLQFRPIKCRSPDLEKSQIVFELNPVP